MDKKLANKLNIVLMGLLGIGAFSRIVTGLLLIYQASGDLGLSLLGIFLLPIFNFIAIYLVYKKARKGYSLAMVLSALNIFSLLMGNFPLVILPILALILSFLLLRNLPKAEKKEEKERKGELGIIGSIVLGIGLLVAVLLYMIFILKLKSIILSLKITG